jgi:uncharacterized protein YggE
LSDLRSKIVKVSFLFALVLVIFPEISAAQNVATISVSGRGEVSLAPDQATISLGVETTALTARTALSDNSTQMAAVMDALSVEGIAPEDTQTSQLALHPRWDRQGNGRTPQISGYSASNMLFVIVRDIDRLGAVLDSLSRAGANRINNIQFDVDDPSQARNTARRLAVEDARAKVALYADAAGVGLGDLVSLNEGSARSQQPMPMARAEMGSMADVPIAQGTLTMHATVHMVYEVAQN